MTVTETVDAFHFGEFFIVQPKGQTPSVLSRFIQLERATADEVIEQFAEIMKKIGTAKNGDTVALDFSADGVAVGFLQIT